MVNECGTLEMKWTISFLFSYLTSLLLLLHSKVLSLAHKDNDRADYPDSQQAEGENQELQLYNLKLIGDWLFYQQLSKHILPIFYINPSLVKQNFKMILTI